MRSSDDVTKGGCWPAPARPALFLGYGLSVLTTRQKQKRCVCVFYLPRSFLCNFFFYFLWEKKTKQNKNIMVWRSIGSAERNATFRPVSEQVEKQPACALLLVFLVVFWEGRPGAGFLFWEKGRVWGGVRMQLPC